MIIHSNVHYLQIEPVYLRGIYGCCPLTNQLTLSLNMKCFLVSSAALSVLFFVAPFQAHAAIAFDAAASSSNSGASSLTYSHTVTGTNTGIVVAVMSQSGDDITSVTYNSAVATQVSKIHAYDSGLWIYLYYLVNPSTGTHDVTITRSGSTGVLYGLSSSYTGTKQSGQPDASVSATGTANSATPALTTVADNTWIVSYVRYDNGGATGNGVTVRASLESSSNVLGDTNAGMTSPGSYSKGYNSTASNAYGILNLSIAPAPENIIGFGTANRLAKFVATTTLGNSLFSDDGSNTTLTAGNLFMQISSLIDSVTSGALNFGTTNATTMTFGRSGQNMIINSKVGIGTSTPTAMLHVSGELFANLINVMADGLGIDTLTAGTLAIGSTTASAITIGRTGATTTIPTLLVGKQNTSETCNSTASPAVCGSAAAGSVAMATGGSTLIVNTTAVTANSQIMITEDSSLGTRLGITCNTTTGRTYSISARTAGTSFTIKSSANPNSNKACLSYWIVN